MEIRKDPRGTKTPEERKAQAIKADAWREACLRYREQERATTGDAYIPSERAMLANLDAHFYSANASRDYGPRCCAKGSRERVGGHKASY